ncbi:MAG: hypothetical protein IH614_14225 [Desulfuromonadales bacterium]|nr:hypothetical protein [Desulfuromonadales bacterium]
MTRLFALILLVFAFASPVQAFQIGPATPAAGHGEVALGAGYWFYQAEWESIDIEQSRGYLHVGYGLGMLDEPRWEIFLRGGAADLEDDSGQFDADFEPFVAGGIKGAFYEGRHFGWGMALQGGYFAGFDSGDIDVDEQWEIEFALPFQARLGPVLLYAGPVVYHTEIDASNGFGPETKMEEDNNFGGFAGVGLDFGRVRLELEAQLKSEFSAGGFLAVRF